MSNEFYAKVIGAVNHAKNMMDGYNDGNRGKDCGIEKALNPVLSKE